MFRNFMVVTDSAVFRIIHPESAKELVFSFESAHGGIDRSDLRRPGFGESFLLQNGYAVVSVLPNTVNWFLPKDIAGFLGSPELIDFTKQFDVVHTYGSSMGAFGACVFAELLNADNVVAIAPVSTLNSTLVPWEKRFQLGARMDWTGEFSDAVRGLGKKASVYCLYDEKCPDGKHALRLRQQAGENFRKILIPGALHAVALKLSACKLLKPIVLDCLRQKDPASISRHLENYDVEEGARAFEQATRQGGKATLALISH